MFNLLNFFNSRKVPKFKNTIAQFNEKRKCFSFFCNYFLYYSEQSIKLQIVKHWYDTLDERSLYFRSYPLQKVIHSPKS